MKASKLVPPTTKLDATMNSGFPNDGLTNPKFPSAVSGSPSSQEDEDIIQMSPGIILVVGILILAVIIINIIGTVAAVKFVGRKKPTEGAKVAAGVTAAGGWLVFPFLSIIPIIMEGNAAKAEKEAKKER